MKQQIPSSTSKSKRKISGCFFIILGVIILLPMFIVLLLFIFFKIPIGGRFYVNSAGVYYLDDCTFMSGGGCAGGRDYYKIEEADLLTFRSMSNKICDPFDEDDKCLWGKDKNNVYFLERTYGDAYSEVNYKIIDGADTSSFELVNEEFQKDKNNVYYQGVIIEDVDSKSFEIINGSYAKDRNHLIYQDNVTQGDVDKNSFEIIDNYYGLARDDEHVYIRGYRFSLEELDPDTLEFVYGPVSDVEVGEYPLFWGLRIQDKNGKYVFLDGNLFNVEYFEFDGLVTNYLGVLRQNAIEGEEYLSNKLKTDKNFLEYSCNSDLCGFSKIHEFKELTKPYNDDEIMSLLNQTEFKVVPTDQGVFLVRAVDVNSDGADFFDAFVINASEDFWPEYAEDTSPLDQVGYFATYCINFNGTDASYTYDIGDKTFYKTFETPEGYAQVKPGILYSGAMSGTDSYFSFYYDTNDPRNGKVVYWYSCPSPVSKITPVVVDFSYDVDSGDIEETFYWFTYEDKHFVIAPKLKSEGEISVNVSADEEE
ncbi:DKNYY domain-containing protein [Candidatus Dojkabacteria bacterium]|nr:DKNYY domain-containing protein [Candidatus Dojkabacteria bacterium]